MKKVWHYILGAVLAIAALAAVFLAYSLSKGHDDQTTNQVSQTPIKTQSQACKIFTAVEAKTLLGSAKGGAPAAGQSSPDLAISSCSYTESGSSTAPADHKSAALLVRSPKTEKGVTSNNNEFGALRPTTVQDVSGYGDQAFWDAEHGQLNILKNNVWYILSFGTASPASRSLDQTRQLADMLISKL